jgi:hypothetical protein
VFYLLLILTLLLLGVSRGQQSIKGQNNLNFKKVGMIFDLDESFPNQSWDLLPSFCDNLRHRAGFGPLSEFKKNSNVYFSALVSPILSRLGPIERSWPKVFFQRRGFGHG